jgi:hypothetical protein
VRGAKAAGLAVVGVMKECAQHMWAERGVGMRAKRFYLLAVAMFMGPLLFFKKGGKSRKPFLC